MTHVKYIDRTREYYLSQGYEKPYRWAHFDETPFMPLKKPLSESRVTLVSTSEIAVRSWDDQRTPLEKGEAANVYDVAADTPVEELYSQTYDFDKHATSLDDVNTYFPVTRMHEAAESGRIGSVASTLYGVYNAYSQRKTREIDAPEVLRRCRDEDVDLAILTPV